MADVITLKRWTAHITYRRDAGNETRVVSFEELHELHDIVEAGPDFYAIDKIEIRINGIERLLGSRAAPTTIEQAERT